MAANAANVRIGEVEVYLDYLDGNGERHLGHTLGGAEFTFEREFTDLTVDQYGTSPVDMALNGNNLLIKVMLAEITAQNIGDAIPEGVYAASGSDGKVSLGRSSGYLLSNKDGQLRLHPRRNASNNYNEDIYIWRAVSVETVELAYKVDEQRVLEITFRALVDETQPEGRLLGQVGDNAIS